MSNPRTHVCEYMDDGPDDCSQPRTACGLYHLLWLILGCTCALALNHTQNVNEMIEVVKMGRMSLATRFHNLKDREALGERVCLLPKKYTMTGSVANCQTVKPQRKLEDQQKLDTILDVLTSIGDELASHGSDIYNIRWKSEAIQDKLEQQMVSY